MQHYSLLCVGAVYQDVILHVPRFPREDSKLRATSRTVRVGGNIINLLRVFKQVRETTNVTYQLGLLCSMGEGSGEGIRVVQSIEEEIGVKVGYKLREGIGISTAYVAEDTEGKGRSIISWSE